MKLKIVFITRRDYIQAETSRSREKIDLFVTAVTSNGIVSAGALERGHLGRAVKCSGLPRFREVFARI